MLEIAVHRDDRVAFGQIHAAGDGNLVAEISREGDGPHMGIRRGDGGEFFFRAVGGAVVDVEDLVVHGESFHDARHFIVEVGHIVFFIVNRGDDGDHSLLLSKCFFYYSVYFFGR